MKYRMSEGMTNIGTPLKEAMERTPRPNTPLGLPLFWAAPAPRPDGSLINEGTKEPEQEPDKYVMDIECTKCGAKQSGVLTVNTTPSQRKPLTDEQKIVLGFLDGSNPLQGVWYGDDHPYFGQAKYWWRQFLRQAFADDFSAHGIKE